ncbi:MAG: phosphoglycerate dehydrogenase [Armatimonadetes bacterium]|nr:phosphoglycerate dehydrogenase [Armatimonadota bacterium]
MKILVTENISERGLRILNEAAPVDVRIGLQGEALCRAVADFSVLVVRSATQVTREVIEAAPGLKIIGRCGVGVDNIDVDAATEHGVLVINSPFGNTVAAAEHTLSMMMALARNLPEAHRSLREGRWERSLFTGVELRDKVLGVVGLGKIGSEVAKRAQALDMHVICFDPQVNAERARNMSIEVVGYDELLRRCDFLTYHVPLNPHTRNLLTTERIELMKPTARVVNCSRGGVVNEADLAAALHAGRLAGAAIDVWENEPPLGEHRSPLLDAPNLVCTPHLGASTLEAQDNVAVDVARQVLAAFRGEPVPGAVNLPMLDAEEHRRLMPYFHLAEHLGRFLAQLTLGGRIVRVDISYLGKLHQEPTDPIARAALRGLLRTYQGDDTINAVNVPMVVEGMGIQVSETRSIESPTYQAVLRVGLTTESARHVADGCCFGADPRVVALDGYGFNIVPQGHLIVWWNTDQPGVIGKVGTLLGDAGINIAGMQLGRDAVGGRAVSIVEVDSPTDPAILEQVAEIPGMLEVRAVDFGNGGELRPVLPVPQAE